MTNHLDGWINVRFQSRQGDPTIGNDGFGTGGAGDAQWTLVWPAVMRVRDTARSFLSEQSEEDLNHSIAYTAPIRSYDRPGYHCGTPSCDSAHTITCISAKPARL